MRWRACNHRMIRLWPSLSFRRPRNDTNAERFIHALRSAVMMVNASSRFSDGGELGLGAEIGISTTRLHTYRPMGAESLTVERFVVRGVGQTRNV
jgi:glutamate-5-semialdehyde dehydrogenase